MKITNKYLDKLTPARRRYTVALGEGLFLRVYPSGIKSWCLRAYLYGRARDFILGRFPALDMQQARQAAHLKRAELQAAPSVGLTLRDAFKLWQGKKKGLSSYHDECARIELHILPGLGSLPLEQVTAPAALNALKPLAARLPTLRRCLMRLNEMLDLSVCAGLLAANPCKGLGKIFAPHVAEHRPSIPASELGTLFALLQGVAEWFRYFVLFAVYSMLRPSELCAIRRAWIEGDILTIPAERMKKRREHRVPLCPGALRLVELLKALRPRSAFLFPFGRGGNPVNSQFLSKWLLSTPLKGKLCHHGLRAMGRTWLHDQGCPFEVGEDFLAHLTFSQTARSYLRSDCLEQRRPWAEKWWDFIYAHYCAHCAPLSGI